MTLFSRFGIWEQELNDLFNQLFSRPLTKWANEEMYENDLKDWFYSDGMLLMIKEHGEFYNNTGLNKQPLIKSSDIINQKKAGFEKLQHEFYTRFLQKTPETERFIKPLFSAFIEKAINNHIHFYNLQADIATQKNKFVLKCSTLSQDDIKDLFEFVMSLYKKHQLVLQTRILKYQNTLALIEKNENCDLIDLEQTPKPKLSSPSLANSSNFYAISKYKVRHYTYDKETETFKRKRLDMLFNDQERLNLIQALELAKQRKATPHDLEIIASFTNTYSYLQQDQQLNQKIENQILLMQEHKHYLYGLQHHNESHVALNLIQKSFFHAQAIQSEVLEQFNPKVRAFT